MESPQVFATERLLLKPTSEEDTDLILELVNTPKWLQYIGDRQVHTLEDARNYIATKMTPQLEKLGYGNYTLIRKADQVKLGTCGLYDRPEIDGLDIGFALLPAYEKQGYATEAALKVKSLALTKFGINEINAITTTTNFSSQKLLERLGLKRVGTMILSDSQEKLWLYRFEQ